MNFALYISEGTIVKRHMPQIKKLLGVKGGLGDVDSNGDFCKLY